MAKNKKKSAATSSSSSSLPMDSQQVDLVVALKAPPQPSPTHQEMAAGGNSKLGYGSNLGVSSQTASRAPATGSAPATATAQPIPEVRRSSNPRVVEKMKILEGELKIMSPGLAKALGSGFKPGHIDEFDYTDPNVAKFFGRPVAVPILPDLSEIVNAGAGVLDRQSCADDLAAGLGAGMNTAQPIAVALPPPVPAPKSPALPMIPAPATKVAVASPVANSGTAANVVIAGTSKSAVQAGTPVNTTGNAQNAAPWAGLFKNNRVPTDDTELKLNLNGVLADRVVLTDDVLDDVNEEKRTLIGFFNGRFPGLKSVQSIVDAWPRKCKFHQHNSGWLVFIFEEEADLEMILKGEISYAFGKPLVLKQMPPFFDFGSDAYSTAPVWIQLPNLPLRAWRKESLEIICSYLGTPLHVDQVTYNKDNISFARCLVDMDVSKDLPKTVTVDFPDVTLVQHVLYEKVPSFCSKCTKLGHESLECNSNSDGRPSLYVPKSSREKRELRGGAKTAVNKTGYTAKGAAQATANSGYGAANRAGTENRAGTDSGPAGQRQGAAGKGPAVAPNSGDAQKNFSGTHRGSSWADDAEIPNVPNNGNTI